MDMDTSIETEKRETATDQAQEQINVQNKEDEERSVSTRAEKQKNIQKTKQFKIAKLEFQKNKAKEFLGVLWSTYAAMPDQIPKIKMSAPPQNSETRSEQDIKPERNIKENVKPVPQQEAGYIDWQQQKRTESRDLASEKPTQRTQQPPASAKSESGESEGAGTTNRTSGANATGKSVSTNTTNREQRASNPQHSRDRQPIEERQQQFKEQKASPDVQPEIEMVPNQAKINVKNMIECTMCKIEQIEIDINSLKKEEEESKKIQEILARQAMAASSYN